MKTLITLASLALAVGCGHGPAVTPVQAAVGGPGGVHVQLFKVQGNILKFMVHNDLADPVIIDRDQVYVRTPNGELHRLPGGSEGTYVAAAHGQHDLFVRFDFAGVPEGAQLEVHFERAITDNGRPVAIDPIIVARR